MKKIFLYLLIICSLLFTTDVFAKTQELKEIIGSDETNTFNESVVSNDDGTYVIVGQSDKKAFISKYDKEDNLIWTKIHECGGTFESFLDVEKFNDGYIVVGFSNNVETGTNALYLILDKDGNKISGDVTEDEDSTFYFSDVEVMDDGKYVVAGELDGDAVLFIFDKDSKLLAGNKFAGSEFSGVTLTSKGTIIAVGRLTERPIIYEIDMNAKALWGMDYRYNESLLPIVENGDESLGVAFSPNIAQRGFLDVVEVEDGYLVVGSEYAGNIPENNTRAMDYLVPIIVKYDKNGKYLWTKTYNDKIGDGRFTDIEIIDDGYYVTGNVQEIAEIKSFDESKNIDENLGAVWVSLEYPIVLKIDKDFNYEWQEVRDFQGTVNNVEVLDDGSFIAVGGVKYTYYNTDEFISSKSYVLKTNVSYSINVNATENGEFTASNEEGKMDIVKLNDKGIITVTPNEGYKLDIVKVVDSKGNEVVVTLEDDGTYTYPIYDDTWVTVTFKEIPPIPENPKTGIANYTSILIFVVIMAGIVYFNTRKQDVFKGI